MTIERLNGIEPVKNVQAIRQSHKTASLQKNDSIQVSQDAQTLAEVHFALEAVKNAPDIREDKVAEMTKKFADPSYMNDALLDSVADTILSSYGL